MVSYYYCDKTDIQKGENMNRTFEVMETYIGNRQIRAYENVDCVLDIILNDYDVDGACKVLEALG